MKSLDIDLGRLNMCGGGGGGGHVCWVNLDSVKELMS
jgi:hypothetical protein